MPQPTTNSSPFRRKVLPSADGHTGGEVAGAGAAEDETVADKLADAGTLDNGVTNKLPLEVLVSEDEI